MIRPYWVSEDRWPGLGLLLVVVSLTLGMVYLSVLLNRWNNDFFSALQEKNAAAFRRQLVQVGWLVGAFIVLAVYQLYLNQMLEIRWRRWLTERYLRAWLTDRAYYRMQLVAGETDNPDQRIAEDVQLLISHTLALFIGGLRAVVTLGTFVAILWGLSGRLTVPIGGLTLVLPGYMVWVSILYAAGGTWLTDWIGRPLVRLNFDRQRYEADFRFSLVRFRENTEGVALYRGEPDEFRGFRALFEAVVRNWWGIMRRQKRLTSFTSGYSQGAWIVPSVVAAPRYFRGELGLGPPRRRRRHAPDRRGRGPPPPRRPAPRDARESLAAPRRQRAPGGRLGLGQEHALPRHRRDLAVRTRRDSRVAPGPRPLSPPATVPADRHPPQRGELPDARRGGG